MDIVLDQDLRAKLVEMKNELIKKSRSSMTKKISTNSENFEISMLLVYDHLHNKEPIGYLLQITCDEQTALLSAVEQNEIYENSLKLRFNENESLKQRVQKSLRFLNHTFGATVEDVINMVETKDLIEVSLVILL
jgi:hypothetical protein